MYYYLITVVCMAPLIWYVSPVYTLDQRSSSNWVSIVLRTTTPKMPCKLLLEEEKNLFYNFPTDKDLHIDSFVPPNSSADTLLILIQAGWEHIMFGGRICWGLRLPLQIPIQMESQSVSDSSKQQAFKFNFLKCCTSVR